MSYQKAYATSPRKRVNDIFIDALTDKFDDDVKVAFTMCLVTRGRRIGCLKVNAPSGRIAPLVWHAYNDAHLESNAAQHGFFPNRSYGGTIFAMMSCGRDDAKEIYDFVNRFWRAVFDAEKKARAAA